MKAFIKEKLNDELLKHGGILFAANILGGFFNFLFQIFMNHGLPPSQFAALYVLMAVTMIISVPGMSIQTLMAKQISHLKAKNQLQAAPSLVMHFLNRVILAAAAILAAMICLRGRIDSFLNIENSTSIVIAAFIVFLALVLPVGYGVLQGLQRFTALGFSLILFGLGRFALSLILVFLLKAGLSGALGSSIFAFVLTAILIFAILKKEFEVDIKKEASLEKIDSFMWTLLVSFALAYILTFIDIIFVKHFFSPAESARYSSVSVLARIVFYFPWAIAGAMFPKVSYAYAKGGETKPLLKRSLKYAFLLSIVPAVCFLILPDFFLRFLKADYLGTAFLLQIFGFALIPFVLLTVLVYYHLAVHNKKIIYILGISTVFHLTMLNFFHQSLSIVIAVMALSGSLIFLYTFKITFAKQKALPS